MMLSTVLLSSLVSLGLALPIISTLVNTDAADVKSLAKRNPNQIQWCKDTGFRNCQLQHFEMSECNSVLFPGEVSGVIVSNVDFESVSLWDGDKCTGVGITLHDSDGDLHDKNYNDRARSFQMTPLPSFNPGGGKRDIKRDTEAVADIEILKLPPPHEVPEFHLTPTHKVPGPHKVPAFHLSPASTSVA